MMKIGLVVILGVRLLGGVAVGGGLPRRLAGFLAERGRDLLDVVEVSVGVGPGAKVHVAYGVQFLGVGDVRSRRLGILDRRVGVWRELDTEMGLFPIGLLGWPLHHAAGAVGLRQLASDARFLAQDATDGFQHLDRKELNGDPGFILRDTVTGPVHARWGESFPIGVEVHALVGLRATMRPLQLVDFVVGFLGLDLDPWLARSPEE